MTSDHTNAIQFLTIINNLEKLSAQATRSNHGREFLRLTLNYRVLTKLQADIYKRDAAIERVTDAELLMLKRASVFNWSALQSSIDFFRWSRNSSVQELSSQAVIAARGNSLLIALMALRSILEVSGNAILLKNDLEQLVDLKDEAVARMDWLNEVESLVDGRIAGVRVDYSAVTTKGLRASGKVSYKPGDFEADQTAKDLLKGVDALDKKIKGARAAYEFFSEFAHPNLASVWTHYDRQEMKIKILDIHCYAVHHVQNKVGAAFLETFGPVLAEAIEIASECIDELLRIDLYLKTKGEEVAKYAKQSIREIIKRDPHAFDRRETCPCNSGKNIQQCCGKLISTSKFGKWSVAAPLH